MAFKHNLFNAHKGYVHRKTHFAFMLEQTSPLWRQSGNNGGEVSAPAADPPTWRCWKRLVLYIIYFICFGVGSRIRTKSSFHVCTVTVLQFGERILKKSSFHLGKVVWRENFKKLSFHICIVCVRGFGERILKKLSFHICIVCVRGNFEKSSFHICTVFVECLVEEFSKLSFHICSVTVQRLGGRILKVKKLSFHSGKAVCQ